MCPLSYPLLLCFPVLAYTRAESPNPLDCTVLSNQEEQVGKGPHVEPFQECARGPHLHMDSHPCLVNPVDSESQLLFPITAEGPKICLLVTSGGSGPLSSSLPCCCHLISTTSRQALLLGAQLGKWTRMQTGESPPLSLLPQLHSGSCTKEEFLPICCSVPGYHKRGKAAGTLYNYLPGINWESAGLKLTFNVHGE